MTKYCIPLGVVLLFLACQRNVDDPPAPEKQCRVTRMVQGLHNGSGKDSVFTFFYNVAGQLERVHAKFVASEFDHTLHYDALGRLVKLDDNFDFSPGVFMYNAQGRLKEMQARYSGDSIKIVFEYTADSLPISAEEYKYASGQWELQGEKKYTFQGGNLVKIVFAGSFNLTWQENIEYYDAIPNRLGNLALIGFYALDLGYHNDGYLFSKNMLKRTTHSSTNPVYLTYKLDSGRIVSSVENRFRGVDTFHKASRFYEYECR